MTFLTLENALTTDSPEGDTMGADLEADYTAGNDSYSSVSDTELWKNFNFPELTPEEDAQLTIALQGGTPQPASSIETSTAIVRHESTEDSSHMHSGVVSLRDEDSSEIDAFGPPPPYMSEFSNNAEPVNHNILVGGNDTSPSSISSTDRPFYVLIDGVYHIFHRV